MDTVYVYEYHEFNDIFMTDRELTDEERYCDCEVYDTLMRECHTEEELCAALKELLKTRDLIPCKNYFEIMGLYGGHPAPSCCTQIGIIEKNLEIVVYPFDPCVICPHFHILDIKTKGARFSSAVKIAAPAYCVHEGFHDALPPDMRDALAQFLSVGDTWTRLLNVWNLRNNRHPDGPPTQLVDLQQPLPDYRALPDEPPQESMQDPRELRWY